MVSRWRLLQVTKIDRDQIGSEALRFLIAGLRNGIKNRPSLDSALPAVLAEPS